MLSILEFAAVVAMAFFGIFGSLVDFRDEKGNVSLKGWIGLIGVIVASSIVGLLQIYSSFQEETRALTLLDKNNAILNDINRTMNPLQGLTAEILLTADWSTGSLEDYFKEFEDGLNSQNQFGTAPLPQPLCDNHSEIDIPVQATDSPFRFPEVSCDKGQVINDVFCAFEIVLFFFKDPIPLEEYNYAGIGENHGEDLRITLPSKCRFDEFLEELLQEVRKKQNSDTVLSPKITKTIDGIEQRLAASRSNISLEYDVREGKIRRLDFQTRYSDPEAIFQDWEGNSKIISLYDLIGAHLIIKFVIPVLIRSEELRNLLQTVTLRRLVLKLPHGIFLSFDSSNLKLYESEYDYKFYSIRFPDNVEDLLALTAYDRFSLLE